MNKLINNNLVWMNNVDGLLLASTCVSMMWNISAPLPVSRLGILMSTLEPGNLLGPLFIAWKDITQKEKTDKYTKKHFNTYFGIYSLPIVPEK